MAEALTPGLLNRADSLDRPGASKRPPGPWALPASGRPSPLAAFLGVEKHGFSARRRPRPCPMGPGVGSWFRPPPRLFAEPLGSSLAAGTAPRGVGTCKETGYGEGNKDRREAHKEPGRRGIGSRYGEGV